jgi:hypothetical protein
MGTFIGQCRGDLALLMRQLRALHITVTPSAVTNPRGVAFVILGDLVAPLNAWCSYQHRVHSDDIQILQLVVRLSEELGVGIVAGLNELLLMSGDTRLCGTGRNHRLLLRLVSDPDFRDAWGRACNKAPADVKRAARHIKGILHDNETRPPPHAMQSHWGLMSALDRGTRFVLKNVDIQPVGFASSAFQPTPFALASHMHLEYHRARCDLEKWKDIVAAIAHTYKRFDDARRRTVALVGGRGVRDTESGILTEEGAREFATYLTSALEPLVSRLQKDGCSAASLTRVATEALTW